MNSAIAAAILTSACAWAQTPVFEVAEARVSKTAPADSYAVLEGTRVEFRGASMLEMIAAAYHLPNDRVLGGPSWLDADRFDVTARAPRDTPEETVRVMLQGLLAERFKLEIRKEQRPMPIFVLTVSKRGLKLKESSRRPAIRLPTRRQSSAQPRVELRSHHDRPDCRIPSTSRWWVSAASRDRRNRTQRRIRFLSRMDRPRIAARGR